MNLWVPIFRAAAVFASSGLLWFGMVSGPSAFFEVRPGNPSALSAVQFADRSGGGAAVSWFWTFGDGESSTLQSPSHVYAAAGSYPVTLRVSNSGGTAQTTQTVEVAAEDTLRLLVQAGHTFEVTLSARDPRTGNTGDGVAVPQNDVFGYFTIPALVPTNPGAPLVPEVFVKMLDARPIPGQDFWFFWGGLTDLEYTMTVRDTVRGTVKVYHNPVTGSPACLGADTSGFASAATPTPTATGPAPTPTPGSAATIVNLSVKRFEWSFNASGSAFQMHVGQTYEVHITNTDPAGMPAHGFSGIAALGMSGAILDPGATVTRSVMPTAGQLGTYNFRCSQECGAGHEQMVASIQVVP
jgi:PKD repeat protein